MVMQELIWPVRAHRYERTAARVTDRKGSRPKSVATQRAWSSASPAPA